MRELLHLRKADEHALRGPLTGVTSTLLSVQWCVGADPKLADNVTDYQPFYSNPKCIGLVQNTVNMFLNRTNTGAPSALTAMGSALARRLSIRFMPSQRCTKHVAQQRGGRLMGLRVVACTTYPLTAFGYHTCCAEPGCIWRRLVRPRPSALLKAADTPADRSLCSQGQGCVDMS